MTEEENVAELREEIEELEQQQEARSRELPKLVKIIAGLILYGLALWLLYSAIVLIVLIFNESWKTGLALFMTGLGEAIFFLPSILAFAGPSMVREWAEDSSNAWEKWSKATIGFVAVFLIPSALHFLIALGTLYYLS